MTQYHVVGLMSGSSLDGLDIAFVRLSPAEVSWQYEWLATDCIPYPQEWLDKLRTAQQLPVPQFLELHTAYGRYIGEAVNAFLTKHAGPGRPSLISSHGHTVYHNPAARTSTQIGDGASIAAVTGIATVTDLRNMDVALAGQGAPIVPAGDRLLFSSYDALLNLGGIANISIRRRDGSYIAFDICPCNQLLDYYARQAGMKYDDRGRLAGSGKISESLLTRLQEAPFYKEEPPKSLANEFSRDIMLPMVDAAGLSTMDALATCTGHIADLISETIKRYCPAKVLVTGGGAFNDVLTGRLRRASAAQGSEIVVPDPQLISYKEALVMALLGALRQQSRANVFASVTGATRDSIGGAIWAGIP